MVKPTGPLTWNIVVWPRSAYHRSQWSMASSRGIPARRRRARSWPVLCSRGPTGAATTRARPARPPPSPGRHQREVVDGYAQVRRARARRRWWDRLGGDDVAAGHGHAAALVDEEEIVGADGEAPDHVSGAGRCRTGAGARRPECRRSAAPTGPADHQLPSQRWGVRVAAGHVRHTRPSTTLALSSLL